MGVEYFWGSHPPKFCLRQDNDTVITIVMPEPSKCSIDQPPEHEVIKNYKGDVIHEVKFFRFKVELRFEGLTQDLMAKVAQILSWQKGIHYHPDNTIDYFSIPITVEEHEFFNVDSKTFHDGIEMLLKGINRQKNVLAGLDALVITSTNKYIGD